MSILKDVGIRAETLNKRVIRLSDSDVQKWAREAIESTKREFGALLMIQFREALVEHRIIVRFDQQDFDIAEFMPITELQKVRAAALDLLNKPAA
jgi:hypothetical protein